MIGKSDICLTAEGLARFRKAGKESLTQGGLSARIDRMSTLSFNKSVLSRH